MFSATAQGYLTQDPKIVDGEYGRYMDVQLRAKLYGGKDAIFLSGRVFGKKIEVCEKYFFKGGAVTLLVGIRKFRTFQMRDGSNAFAADCDIFDFSIPPSDNQVRQNTQAAVAGFDGGDDDEIPF